MALSLSSQAEEAYQQLQMIFWKIHLKKRTSFLTLIMITTANVSILIYGYLKGIYGNCKA